MGMLRKCYDVPVCFFRDAPGLVTVVHYFFVPSTNLAMPFPHAFDPKNWDIGERVAPVGQQLGIVRFTKGNPSRRYQGANFCGTIDQWQNGCLTTDPLPPIDPTTGAPFCCGRVGQLAAGGFLLAGGAQAGIVFPFVATGGLVLAGGATVSWGTSYAAAGGLVLAGGATVVFTPAIFETTLGTASSPSAASVSIANVTLAAGQELVVTFAVINNAAPTVKWGTTVVPIVSSQAVAPSGTVGIAALAITSGGTNTLTLAPSVGLSALAMAAVKVSNLPSNVVDVTANGSGTVTAPTVTAGSLTAAAREFGQAAFLLSNTGLPVTGGTWLGAFASQGQDVPFSVGPTNYLLQGGFAVYSTISLPSAQLSGSVQSNYYGALATVK